MTLCLDARSEMQMVRPVAESDARRDAQARELTLQSLRIVVGCHLGVELFLLHSRFATGYDVSANALHSLLECMVRLRTQPRLGETFLQRFGPTEIAEDD